MTEPTRPASRSEAAEYARVSVMTIDRWIKAGRLTRYASEIQGGPGRPQVFVDLDEIDLINRRVAS